MIDRILVNISGEFNFILEDEFKRWSLNLCINIQAVEAETAYKQCVRDANEQQRQLEEVKVIIYVAELYFLKPFGVIVITTNYYYNIDDDDNDNNVFSFHRFSYYKLIIDRWCSKSTKHNTT